jgi:hypothetical protein
LVSPWADADSDSYSSSEGGHVADGGGATPPDSPVRRNSSPSYDEQPESPDKEAEDRDDPHLEPDVSDEDSDFGNGPEGRFHTMSSHLAKLDSLTARGCADKFFKVHTDRWAPSMPRPGDYLHSARAGGTDPRDIRKRRAANISRSTAETHAFCCSSNLSLRRSDCHLDTFTNVSTFVMCIIVVCVS